MKNLITFGADPEFFVEVEYKSNDNTAISKSIEPSTLFFADEVDKPYGVHNDGYQAELKVKAHNTVDGMVNNIKQALNVAKDEFDKRMKQHKSINSYRFLCIPAIRVTKNQINYGGEQCQIFGCKPDYNIYNTGDIQNKNNLNAKTHLFRYSGGHIHAGESKLSKALLQSSTFIKLCDVIIGNTMVMLDKHPNNKFRNKYYGKAGVFRQPDYGTEYRTLSSYWFTHPTIAKFTFKLLNLSAAIMVHKDTDSLLKNACVPLVKKAIDNFDSKQATTNFSNLLKILDKMNIKHTLEKDIAEIKKLKYDENILINWGITKK